MFQVKIVGRRLDEEEVLKEEVRSRRREEGRGKERREEERRFVELSRAEKNREWRRRKEEEEEGSSPVEEREDVLGLALLRELECLGCGMALVAPKTVLQCLGGHVACTDCRDRGKVSHIVVYIS